MGNRLNVDDMLRAAILPDTTETDFLPLGGSACLGTEKKWLAGYGTTVPTDATAGYSPGCVYLHTDGSDQTAGYLNVGTLASCDFNAILTTPPSLGDNVALTFGTGSDVTVVWDASKLQISPATDDIGSINIGDGTKDIDLKWFGGTSTAYAVFDVGNVRLQLEDVGMKINTLSSTVGNGYPLSETLTVALGAYGDDANAAIGSGTMIRSIEGRLLLAYTGGNREQEAVGVLGKLVSKAGTNRHNMAGVMGSYEVNTSLTVDGQATATDTWMQAAVIGRVGAGSAITSVNTNARLAGLAAMSNTTSFAANSGVYAGLYVGKWGGTAGSLLDFDYALYAENVEHGFYIDADAGTVSGEEHGVDLAFTGTMSSGDGLVGLNVVTTTAGTAGSWASAGYMKLVQGATKNVNGYVSVLELELDNNTADSSDNAILVMNSSSNLTGSAPACIPYIMLREYGGSGSYGNVLVRIFGDTGQTGTTDANVLWSTVAAARTHTHSLRIMVGSTPYYVMCTNTGA